ncbi:MAG: hypothetical protein V3V63_03275 [Candidatus Hydrothermarchaeaceae archaeon]|jgi:hypothetical protein
MYEVTGENMADIVTTANQALLDAAEWAGASVWIIIAAIATALLIFIILVFYLVKRKHEVPVKIYTTEGEAGSEALEFVEKTLMEFPADRIRIEGTKGKVVIKLVSPKPVTPEEPLLPQEVKEGPLPSKLEKPKPAESEEPESEPIAMGAVESEEQETK